MQSVIPLLTALVITMILLKSPAALPAFILLIALETSVVIFIAGPFLGGSWLKCEALH